MKPSAYISDGGILFKESPPDSILKLSPLYTSAEIQALHNLVKEQPMLELTDEEIDQIIKQHDWYSKTWVDMVRSIESAILKKVREQ